MKVLVYLGGSLFSDKPERFSVRIEPHSWLSWFRTIITIVYEIYVAKVSKIGNYRRGQLL